MDLLSGRHAQGSYGMHEPSPQPLLARMCPSSNEYVLNELCCCGQGTSLKIEHPRGGHVIGQRIASALESVEQGGSLPAQAWAYGWHDPSPQP